MRSKKAWLIAILVGLLCYLGFSTLLSKPKTATPETEVAQVETKKMGQVVSAVQDIPARTEITADMVKISSKDASNVHPMSALSLDEVIGKVTLIPINAAEDLLVTKIADPDVDFLSYRLKEGMVAHQVSVTELSAAGGMLRVGDKVHIMGDFKSDVAGEDVSQFFMYDVSIIAIGKDMGTNSMADAEGFSSMTLQVSPEDALRLSWAQNHGTLTFILKSVYDTLNMEDIEAVKASTFFGDTAEFKDLKYNELLNKLTQIRSAEEELASFGKGDVQAIREQLNYDNLYYDDLNVSKQEAQSTDGAVSGK